MRKVKKEKEKRKRNFFNIPTKQDVCSEVTIEE